MDKSIYGALSGAMAQEKRLYVITNNLSNQDTPGFKAERPCFSSVLTDEVVGSSARTPDEDLVFGAISATKTDFSQGSAKYTGRRTDICLNGPGFLVVDAPDGERYTRAGNLRLDASGTLVTPDGYNVKGESGEIRLFEGPFNIAPDGTVSQGGAVVDTIKMVEFEDNDKLKKEGKNLFNGDEAGLKDAENTYIMQEYVESSNVDPVRSLVEMISANRGFQVIQKGIKDSYEVSRKVANFGI